MISIPDPFHGCMKWIQIIPNEVDPYPQHCDFNTNVSIGELCSVLPSLVRAPLFHTVVGLVLAAAAYSFYIFSPLGRGILSSLLNNKLSIEL